MTFEEKRALHVEISQMLADAGINQTTLREMVEEVINQKVDRAVEQVINSLNSQTTSGDFIADKIVKVLGNARTEFEIKNAANKILAERVAQELKGYRVVIIKDKE